MSELENSASSVENYSQTPETEALEQEQSVVEEHRIFEEAIEAFEEKEKLWLWFHAVVDIRQASERLMKEKIKLWADRIGVHERTVERKLADVERDGFSALARTKRSDAGITKGSKNWKGKTTEEWIEFIREVFRKGNTASRVMNRNQTFGQVKGHAELELNLKEGEYPSRGFVYETLKPLAQKKKKKRNAGMGPSIILEVTNTDGNKEEIIVERSNQVWQIDHTELDNLLVDADGEVVGTIWITSILDTYSSCVMGFHLSFINPGSHEVALALRHAILQKDYGSEYELREKWETCGLPEYFMIDKAKEFKSGHLRRVTTELGIKLRHRLYTEQGGVVERPFLGIKTEFSGKLGGYRGGSLKERPKNPEKYACVSYEDYERKIVRHIVDHRNMHLYPRIKNQTCQQRWWAGLISEKPRMPSSERDLDICLMKEAKRAIQKYGCIEFECLVYGAGWQKDDQGLWRYDADADFLRDYEEKVTLRYNPSNIVYILVYTREQNGQPSRYLGTVRAKHSQQRDLYCDEERLSLKEWKDRKEKRRNESKAVPQSSIVTEQRDLTQFSDKQISSLRKRKKTTKERKHDEQHRITRNSSHSNVVELPVQNPAQIENNRYTAITDVASSSASANLDSIQEQPKIQKKTKTVLYRVSNWGEYDDDW